MEEDLVQAEARQLEELGRRFIEALVHKDAGRLDMAEEGLRKILKQEPRLAEPRMELARILVDTDRIAEAEGHARDALEQLEVGGQWTDEIDEDVVLSLAHALLAEVLRRKADEDDVIFGDPDAFREIVEESRMHFRRASELDPSDETSGYYAFFMGSEDFELAPGGEE